MKQTLKHLALAMLVAGTIAILRAPITHAATISVASGPDTTNVDSTCTLSEAITNINAGNATAYPECTGTGAFGSTDTIILPTGVITLGADLPDITKAVTIEGAGVSNTTINGGSQWAVFRVNNSAIDTVTIKKMKVKAFREAVINTNSGGPNDLLNLQVSELEVDGTDAVVGNDVVAGIQMLSPGPGAHTLSVENVYIHDLKGAANGTVAGIMAGSANNTLTMNITNVTISNLENTDAGSQAIAVINGPFSSMSPGNLQANISNVTIDNIVSSTDIAAGIGVLSFVTGGDTTATINANAITVRGINGQTNTMFPAGSSAVFIAGMAGAPSDSSTATINLTNALFVNNRLNGTPHNCGIFDLNSAFGGLGVLTATINSNGGNLSDDTTCSPYFTKSTDQNNLGTLGSTLGTLSNNGGFVPTIPLLQGSPAIDAGVTISGMTQDARFATRPQGTAFDSGAYESPFTKPQATLAGTGENLNMIVGIAALVTFGALGVIIKTRKAAF